MIFNGNRITGAEISECFAEFFNGKVLGIVESIKVDQGVYNGHQKIHAEDGMFMTSERITECVKSLKIKKATEQRLVSTHSQTDCTQSIT